MTRNGGSWFADLLLVVLAAGLAGVGIRIGVTGPLRLLVALPLVVFLPGYALTAALFPANGAEAEPGRRTEEVEDLREPLPEGYELDAVERFVLSVTLSIVTVPAVALAWDVAGWEIALQRMLHGVVGVTVTLALVGLVRRLRLPAERRYRPSIPGTGLSPFASRGRPLETRRGRPAWFAPAMAASLILLGASVAYAGMYPPTSDGFSEFYVAGDETGSATNVTPSTLAVGEERSIDVGIGNHERREARYTVVVLQQRVERGSGGETTVVEEDELASRELTVADGESSRVTITVEPTFSGNDVRLLLLLYLGEPPDDPDEASAYRALDLDVTVTGSGAADRSAAGALAGGRTTDSGGPSG